MVSQETRKLRDSGEMLEGRVRDRMCKDVCLGRKKQVEREVLGAAPDGLNSL